MNRFKYLLLAVGVLGSLLSTANVAAAGTRLCFGRVPTILGTHGDDRIKGTAGPDVIVGLGGNDHIQGRGGDDFICAGRGGGSGSSEPEERVFGGRGDDHISGGPGNDYLFGDQGHDDIFGNQSRDYIAGGFGRDRIWGGRGHDLMYGGHGDDVIRSGKGNDHPNGNLGDDRLFGGPGNRDALLFEEYHDRDGGAGTATVPVMVNLETGVVTGYGTDRVWGMEDVWGTPHDDVLIGNDKANVLLAGRGNNVVEGRGGDDCLVYEDGEDEFDGGDGFDFFTADVLSRCGPNRAPSPLFPEGITVDLAEGYAFENGRDERAVLTNIEGIHGSQDDDTLIGDGADNVIFGYNGNDTIEGRDGDDVLDGGPAMDSIDGGDGSDTCVNGEVYFNCENSRAAWR